MRTSICRSLPVLLLLPALPALADVKLEVLGTAESRASAHSLSVPAAGSTYTASGDRSQPQLEARVASDTATSFFARANASARVESTYTVVGLVARAPVTFTWEFSGSLQWNPENASLGLELHAGIFSRGPDLFIDGIRWGISFVDGPVFMGDFAGNAALPIGSSGSAGAPGLFSSNLPAAPWDGRGSVQATTTWVLSGGGWGDLTLAAGTGVGGDVQADHAIRLLGLQVPDASWLSGGPAYLLLDNGTQIPIAAAVPEPGPAVLLLSGLAALAWRRQRMAR